MRHRFFNQAKYIASDIAITAGVSFFSIIFLKAMMNSYHTHREHVKKYPNAKIDSTFWSRFSHTYLPIFPLIASTSSSSSSKAIENNEKSKETGSKSSPSV